MEKKWSNKAPKCLGCGTIERKHAGHGLCTRCYSADRYEKNPDSGREKALRYLERNREKVAAKYKKRYAENKKVICEQQRHYYRYKKAAEWDSMKLKGDLLRVLRYLCYNGSQPLPQMIAWEVGKISGNGSGAWAHARLRRLAHLGYVERGKNGYYPTKTGIKAVKEASREG